MHEGLVEVRCFGSEIIDDLRSHTQSRAKRVLALGRAKALSGSTQHGAWHICLTIIKTFFALAGGSRMICGCSERATAGDTWVPKLATAASIRPTHPRAILPNDVAISRCSHCAGGDTSDGSPRISHVTEGAPRSAGQAPPARAAVTRPAPARRYRRVRQVLNRIILISARGRVAQRRPPVFKCMCPG